MFQENCIILLLFRVLLLFFLTLAEVFMWVTERRVLQHSLERTKVSSSFITLYGSLPKKKTKRKKKWPQWLSEIFSMFSLLYKETKKKKRKMFMFPSWSSLFNFELNIWTSCVHIYFVNALFCFLLMDRYFMSTNRHGRLPTTMDCFKFIS